MDIADVGVPAAGALPIRLALIEAGELRLQPRAREAFGSTTPTTREKRRIGPVWNGRAPYPRWSRRIGVLGVLFTVTPSEGAPPGPR